MDAEESNSAFPFASLVAAGESTTYLRPMTLDSAHVTLPLHDIVTFGHNGATHSSP